MAVCPHCGASDCEAHFHECLVRDFTDPRYGVVHHLTVAAYMLQHNAYTDEVTPTMAAFVRGHLDEPPGAGDKRAIRDANDGSQRVLRRGGAPPLQPVGGWPLTVLDVDLDTAERYRDSVRAWADAVARVVTSGPSPA